MSRAWDKINSFCTSGAFIIAVVSLTFAAYTAAELEKTMVGIQTTMVSIEKTMVDIQTTLTRSGIIADAGLITSNLVDIPYPDYKAQVQGKASFYTNSLPLIVSKPDGTYELTPEGEDMLDAKLRDDIYKIVAANEAISERDIILMFGIRNVVEYSVSWEIPPTVMMGILVTYLEGLLN